MKTLGSHAHVLPGSESPAQAHFIPLPEQHGLTHALLLPVLHVIGQGIKDFARLLKVLLLQHSIVQPLLVSTQGRVQLECAIDSDAEAVYIVLSSVRPKLLFGNALTRVTQQSIEGLLNGRLSFDRDDGVELVVEVLLLLEQGEPVGEVAIAAQFLNLLDAHFKFLLFLSHFILCHPDGHVVRKRPLTKVVVGVTL